MKSMTPALMAIGITVSVMDPAQAMETLPEGPESQIEDLTEEMFIVDGSAGSGRVFTFSNGQRSLYFIPMIHMGEPAYYASVAAEVQRHKADGIDLFYEFIDFDRATVQDKRRVRAMLGFLPSPAFYEENLAEGQVAQDNAIFLGFPGGKDVNVDVTPAELADAYEAQVGPLRISEENQITPLDDFVMPTADPGQLTRVTIDWRNRRLAQAIHDAPGNIVVLYGAAHGAGTLRALKALDSRWERAKRPVDPLP
jgi:hypothetical protein